MATEIIKEFAVSNDPRQTFVIKVGEKRTQIELFTQYDFWAFNIIDADTGDSIVKGRLLLHGNDLFKYCGLDYELRYIHPDGEAGPTRETLNLGVLYLAAFV